MGLRRRAIVLALATALDLTFGDPPNRFHPVAWLGRLAAAMEARSSRQHPLLMGLTLLAVVPLAAVAWAHCILTVARRLPEPLALVLEAVALKHAFAIRSLFEHGDAVECELDNGDLAAARKVVALTVSRDTSRLDSSAVASAAVESLAENTSDSVVAPWCWYLLGGLRAAWAYRAVNTLDAMVGYRDKARIGMPSARTDDAVNYVPARLTALLIAAASIRICRSWAGARDDHQAAPSPNAGWPMAAAAHALGLRLEKPGHHVFNERGRPPGARDIRRAATLLYRALGLFAVLAAALAFATRKRGNL